jgi:hypothetical protein
MTPVRLMPHHGQIEAPPTPCRSSPTGPRVVCGAASQSMQSTRHVLTADGQLPRVIAWRFFTAPLLEGETTQAPGRWLSTRGLCSFRRPVVQERGQPATCWAPGWSCERSRWDAGEHLEGHGGNEQRY